MLDQIDSNQLLVGTGTFGVVLAVIYKIWDVVKSDRRIEKAEVAQDTFRDDLMTEVRELRQEIKSAHEAQVLSARREAELSIQIENLSQQVAEFRRALEDCKNTLRKQ